MSKSLICPLCGSPMRLRVTHRFHYGSGQSRRFYGCSRWPKCEGSHGAHPSGEPLGIPADKETKSWRIRAHESFDDWWERNKLSRNEGYMRLAKHFGIKEVHIGALNIEGCRKVIDFCEADN